MARKLPPPIVRKVVEALGAGGLAPTVARGRKHFRVEFLDRQGCARLIVVSVSPSTRNAERMALGDVRRALRPMEGAQR